MHSLARPVLLLTVLLLALLATSPATAGTTCETLEVVPPEMELPAHDTIVVQAGEGWEPERVQQAVVSALTDPKRGAVKEKLIPEYDVRVPGPNARAVVVLEAGAEPAEGSLVLEVSALEPIADDKLSHRRRNYDHQWKIARRTELKLDYRVIDPATGAIVASDSITVKPKKEGGPWHTDEEGALAAVPSAGDMALTVLDEAAVQVADAVAARWERRKYGFLASDYGKDTVQSLVSTRNVRASVGKLVKIAEQHPDDPDDQFNAALGLALVKDFVAAQEALDRALALDEKGPYKRLAEDLPKWRRQFEDLVASGFPIEPIALDP